jgi:hypothetical protein
MQPPAADEPAAAEAAAADAPADEPADRPRNPDGTFAAAGEPEPAAESAEPTDTPDETQLILGKFRTQDELAAAYSELEQFKGRQAQEIGDLRRLVEERLPAQQEPQPQPQYAYDEVADWASTLPPTQLPAVAQQAFQQGNRVVEAAVLEQWKEHDRGSALQFEQDAAAHRAAQLIQAQQAQQTQAQTTVTQTAQQFVEQHPDFQDLRPVMEQIAQEPAHAYIGRLLASNDPQMQLDGVNLLYDKAKGRTQSDNLNARSTDIAREHALASEQAIRDAAVVSGTAPNAAPVMNRAQELAAEWDKLEAPTRDGWNI